MPQQNLNEVQRNHPIFDLRDVRGGLNSVKTSVRAADTRGDPFGTYLQGLKDVVGLRTGTYARAREALYPALPAADGEALMMRNGYLSVNEDHVEPFRAALRDPENYRRQAYRDIADRFLEIEPVRIAGTVHRRYQTLESTIRGQGTPAALRQQVEAALTGLRERIASRVRGNGISTEHLVHLEGFRQQVAIANPQMSPVEIKGWAFPELLLVAKHGGGVRGNAVAAGVAGARGAYGGAVVSVVFELGHIVYGNMCDEPQPDGGVRLVKAGVAGGVSGFVGGATQSFVMANVGGSLSRGVVGQGVGSRMATSLGRGIGGYAAGGLAAPVFAMTSLALDDESHSRTDYAAVGTRAFISGSLSAAVAAGVVGAIWGTEVPVLGNAVGFIIGFAGYYVVDALTGDRVEQGVRHSLEK